MGAFDHLPSEQELAPKEKHVGAFAELPDEAAPERSFWERAKDAFIPGRAPSRQMTVTPQGAALDMAVSHVPAAPVPVQAGVPQPEEMSSPTNDEEIQREALPPGPPVIRPDTGFETDFAEPQGPLTKAKAAIARRELTISARPPEVGPYDANIRRLGYAPDPWKVLQPQGGISSTQQARSANILGISRATEQAPPMNIPGSRLSRILGEEAKIPEYEKIREATGLPLSFIQKNYDAVTKELGIRGTPTTKELADEMFKWAIGAGLATAPLKMVIGLAGYMGGKEAESVATQALKGEKPKLGAERELKEFLGDLREPFSSAVDVAEFAWPGGISAKGIKTITESSWYQKMTGKEQGLVRLSLEEMLKRGHKEADLVRMSDNYWREAFERRAMGEGAPPPEPGAKTPGVEMPGAKKPRQPKAPKPTEPTKSAFDDLPEEPKVDLEDTYKTILKNEGPETEKLARVLNTSGAITIDTHVRDGNIKMQVSADSEILDKLAEAGAIVEKRPPVKGISESYDVKIPIDHVDRVLSESGLKAKIEPKVDMEEALRPAVKAEDKLFEGEAGTTHQDVLKAQGLEGKPHIRGFLTPSGEFLTREEAKQHVAENQPEVAAKLEEKLGEDFTLHSQDYREAAGIEPAKEEKRLKVYHFTKDENVNKILTEGFNTALPPVHGTGALNKRDKYTPEDKTGTDVIYFTTDKERWSKAEVYVGAGKGEKDYSYYDYDTQKFVEEKKAISTVNLSPVEAEVKANAKILKIDSMKAYLDFQNKNIGNAFPLDRLHDTVNKAKELGYDILNLKHTGKGWEHPKGTLTKYGKKDWYESVTGGSGKDDYFILNKDILDIAKPKPVSAAPAGDLQEPLSPASPLPSPEAAPTPNVPRETPKVKEPGDMSLTEMEEAGVEPWQVTQKRWVEVQREERRRLGQSEESGTPFNKFGDYEEYHRSDVKRAISEGKPVPPEVLKGYPDLFPKAKAPKDMTFDEFEKAYRTAFSDMSKYTVDQVGSKIFADRMAELSDAHPDWVEKIEEKPDPTLEEGLSAKYKVGDKVTATWGDKTFPATITAVPARGRYTVNPYMTVKEMADANIPGPMTIEEKNLALRKEEPAKTPTTDYWERLPSGKIDLIFSKEKFNSLPPGVKEDVRRFFNWAPSRKAWTSKGVKNTYTAREIAKRAGLQEKGKVETPKGEAPAAADEPKVTVKKASIVLSREGVKAVPIEESPEIKIGDVVRPKPESGISAGNGGMVLHIRRNEDGTEWIKTEHTGNMHFKASDWEVVSGEEKSKLDLTVTGQAKPSPDLSGVQYVVHKAKPVLGDTREYRVIMIRPGGDDGGRLSVDAKGFTPEEAYGNALREFNDKSAKGGLKPSLKEKEITPATKIAEKVSSHLKTNKLTIDPYTLFKWSDEAYGGTQAQGKYTVKDAYDAMELGINKRIADSMTIDPTMGAKEAKGQITALKVMMNKIPTQTKRTGEMEQFQQFSTPPSLAYAANWVANIGKEDTYLEPSAGIGGIAVFGKNAGAKEIIVNELSPRRAELLKELGFDRVFSENAEQLNNILPKDVQPTVVVMNPPFSQTAGRMGGRKEIQTGAVHVEQALKRLVDNGRLVAILGRGMAPDKPAFREWWKKIQGEYTVRANVGVSGKEYQKYGTSFDNQLVVIDKTGPTELTPISGQVEKVEDLVDLLKGVRDERPERALATEQQPVKPAGEASLEGVGGVSRPAQPVQRPVGDVGPGNREVQAEGPKPATDLGTDVEGKSGGRGEDLGVQRQRGSGGPVVEEGKPGEVGRPDPRQAGAQAEPGPGVSDTLEVKNKKAGKTEEKDFSDSIYESYRPQKALVPGAKSHPGKLVESAAMSIVEPPDPTYKPHIPKEIITSGKLSEAQLESIIYAGQAHNELLPGEQVLDEKPVKYRKGYFIGDGTGVGKGREISGVLMDNWNQGRKKSVWLSQNSPLINDAKRDVKGIGWKDDLIFDFGKIKFGTPVKMKEGVAFLGYDLLRAKKAQAEKGEGEEKPITSRLDQLTEWLGKDFDGVIVFDEAHNLGNAIGVQGGMGMTRPSAKALAGVELQKRLPNARVLYVSATGATEVSNLSYVDRLGLWGEGTPFASKRDFIERISAGGMAAMEMVARDMKAMGNYLARSLSYDDVSYERLEHTLAPEQREIYDELAKAWQGTLQNVNAAIAVASPETINGRPIVNRHARSAALSAFWGAHQRFFNQVITSMQTPSVITAIEKDLGKGHAAVIQLVNTNAAATERALARMNEDEELEDLDMTPREQLMEFVKNSFPVQQFEQFMDENGNIQTRPVVDSVGKPVENAEAVAMREALLDRLGGIKVPEGPLEMILNHFGTDKVAEITGRQRRVVNFRDEKGERKIIEKRSQAKAMTDADAFSQDKKPILIFSYAGGTGRSYHADLGIKNQRLRRHYLLQAGWRADRAIQGFGRTHRSSQKQAPEYVLVTTDLKGQKRFISSIARRLDQLGALTRGQRETGGQGFFAARDNLESIYAQRALDSLIEDIYRSRVPEMDIQDFERETGIKVTTEQGGLATTNMPPITQFLNRILSMTVEKQNTFFDLFSERMDRNIEKAIEEGTLDQGLETLRAKKIEKIQEQVVYTDKTGAETKYVELEVTNDTTLIKFNEAKPYASLGYIQNIKSGRVWGLSASRNKTDRYGNIEEVHGLTGVDRGKHSALKEDVADPEKYKRLTPAEAKQLWEKELASHPKEMKHREHMISGTLLPIWDRLVGHPRIMRAQTAEGERFIGRIINPGDVAATLKNLGASQSAVKMTGKEALDSVLKQNFTIELANGWTIARRLVSGEQRIEIIGPDYKFYPELTRHGAFTERISYQTRVFIPTTEEGAEALDHILETRPITSANPPVSAKSGGVIVSEAGFLSLDFLTPGLEAGRDIKAGIQSLVAPTAKSPEHLRAAEVLGAKLGAMNRDSEAAAKGLGKDYNRFTKMGVYNPKTPLDQNPGIKFMSDMSQGRRQPTPELQAAADRIKNLFDDRLRKLEAAGAPLNTVRENYFPGMWQDKARATTFLAKRPFKGKESFRKQKVFDDIMDGVDAGMVPISPNPIDLVSLKLAEMDRSIMANRAIREWEAKGDVAEVPYNKPIPDGWEKINDKYGTVWGPPSIPVWKMLKELAKSAKKDLYFAQFGKEVFPSALEVAMGADDTMKTEANGLTWDTPNGPINIHAMRRGTGRSYSQLIIEKLLEDHDAFEAQAPKIYERLQEIADNAPKLKSILGTPTFDDLTQKLPVGGWVMRGYRVAKTPVAEVLNNYLSSSLYNSPYFGTAFKAWMGAANLLNQTQLGVGSAFHAGFTESEVQISGGAKILMDLYGVARGNRTFKDLGTSVAHYPISMGRTPAIGAKVVSEWRTPTINVPENVPVGQLPHDSDSRVAMVAKAAEMAGGGFKLERGLRTEWTDKMVQEWYGSQKFKAGLRTPIAFVELMAKPIMEWLVPRQKAGVFAELAWRTIEQNPGKTMEELRGIFRQHWNRVDARLGQVRYDRLFINNMAKNLIQATIRAPGWTGGTLAEIGGAPKDLANFFREWKRGGFKNPPENIPPRVAYVLSLFATVMAANGLLTYLFTGEDPEGMDWWAFRSGGYDEKGKPERLLLPTYLKDIWSWWQNWGHTAISKTHPLLSVIGDIVKNKDYYGIKIRNEDDNLIQQWLIDTPKYALKQFEPFWIRGAGKEAERGGGLMKTLSESPQKIFAPQIGIMPAPQSFTMTAFDRYAQKLSEEHGWRMRTRTKEQAEKGKMKSTLEMGLRRMDPGAQMDLDLAKAAGEITGKEKRDIERRSGEDPTTKAAKSMSLQELATGIQHANEEEKQIIKPIFKKKIDSKSKELDRDTRQRYLDLLESM